MPHQAGQILVEGYKRTSLQGRGNQKLHTCKLHQGVSGPGLQNVLHWWLGFVFKQGLNSVGLAALELPALTMLALN